jgi:hypothetical protein
VPSGHQATRIKAPSRCCPQSQLQSAGQARHADTAAVPPSSWPRARPHIAPPAWLRNLSRVLRSPGKPTGLPGALAKTRAKSLRPKATFHNCFLCKRRHKPTAQLHRRCIRQLCKVARPPPTAHAPPRERGRARGHDDGGTAAVSAWRACPADCNWDCGQRDGGRSNRKWVTCRVSRNVVY